jgi:hypothetical protein
MHEAPTPDYWPVVIRSIACPIAIEIAGQAALLIVVPTGASTTLLPMPFSTFPPRVTVMPMMLQLTDHQR